MRVLIIADDLTGALDSAVTLAGGGRRCLVARRPADVAAALARRPDVLAVSTASREGEAGAARAAVRAALDAVGTLPPIVFKKVDSRLKGHVAAEVAVVAERAGLGRALLAPAIPAQGRVVVDGLMTGAGVAAPIDVAAAFAATGLASVVPDTRDAAEFDAALAAALAPGAEPALLVGAAGLAGAVARRLDPAPSAPVARLAAPILLAIGSHDPITIAQMEYLAGRGGVEAEQAPDGACPPADTGAAARLIRLVPAPGRPFDARTAGPRFATEVAALLRAGRFGTLFACGGETADSVLGALGEGVLAVEGELLPGVPVSTMVGGETGLRFVTKSGGFGGVDALSRVVAATQGTLEGAR